MKIVILGHTGFLGNTLYNHFKQLKFSSIEGYSSSEIDLCSPSSIHQIKQILNKETVLIICSFSRKNHNEIEGYSQNIIMYQHIAKALELQSVRKCLYLSSNIVYGEGGVDQSVSEKTIINPTSLYGVSTLMGEQILKITADKKKFPINILRACKVYGPGDTDTVSYSPGNFFYTLIRENKIFLFGKGEEKRDFLFIHDFSKIVEQMALNNIEGTFNLATGKSTSFHEVSTLIGSITNTQPKIIFKKRTRPKINIAFQIDKLLQVFPDFQFTKMEQGLIKTHDYMVENSSFH